VTAQELGAGELAAVAGWLAASGVTLAGPLTARPLVGGRSNLTYQLSDGASSWVLRTPPRAGRTPSAHDVAREFRVTSALMATEVPVAPALGLCEDTTLIGVPFVVSAFVAGRTIRTRADLDSLEDSTVDTVVAALVRTLAALHRVDHVAVGLGDFGRPDGYAQRQLRRWSQQWEIVGIAPLRSLAAEVSSGLGAALPPQESTGIVHGDYRVDNTILRLDPDRDAEVAAVVDWELATIGDPVADVAMMCAYRHPLFDLIVGTGSAWTSPRLPSPDALAAAYEAAGGVPLTAWPAHLALAYFKIAVIAAGIDHRVRAGASAGPGFDTAGESVAGYLELSREQLRAS
jgi:aminoglycoside phosphotransferase (APT) family kinase protein